MTTETAKQVSSPKNSVSADKSNAKKVSKPVITIAGKTLKRSVYLFNRVEEIQACCAVGVDWHGAQQVDLDMSILADQAVIQAKPNRFARRYFEKPLKTLLPSVEQSKAMDLFSKKLNLSLFQSALIFNLLNAHNDLQEDLKNGAQDVVGQDHEASSSVRYHRFVKDVLMLVNSGKRGANRNFHIEFMASLPIKTRSEIVKTCSEVSSSLEYRSIVEVFSKVPPHQRTTILFKQCQSLFADVVSGGSESYRAELAAALCEVPMRERGDFVQRCNQLSENMSPLGKVVIAESLVRVSYNEKERLISQYRFLSDGADDGDDTVETWSGGTAVILSTLSKVSSSVRTNAFIMQCQGLYEGLKRSLDRARVIEAFSAIPDSCRNDLFAQQCQTVCSGVQNGHDRADLIAAFARVDAGKRVESFVSDCQKLCKGLSSDAVTLDNEAVVGNGSGEVIDVLARIPSTERDNVFISLCQKLCAHMPFGDNRAMVIDELIKTDAGQRKTLAVLYLQLCKDLEQGYNQPMIFKLLANIPGHDRKRFIAQCKRLCDSVEDVNDRKKIMSVFAELDDDSRSAIYDRALDFIVQRDQLLEPRHIIQIIKTPLDEVIMLHSDIEALTEASAKGAGVNHSDRNDRTLGALQQLWAMETLTEEEVEEEYQEFLEEIEDRMEEVGDVNAPEVLKLNGALQALGEKPIDSIWPRLNDPDNPICYLDNVFPGKALIALIFRFIYREPEENQESLFSGLFSALDATKKTPHSTKAQRIAIAILEGSQQLPGVQINAAPNQGPGE